MSQYFEDEEIFKKVISEIELYKESDISLTQTLNNLRVILKTNKVIPIAEIKISTETLQEMINEKMEEIELDIQEIRNKAIDDFMEKFSLEISESIIWGMIVDWSKHEYMNDISDKIIEYVVETSKKLAEQLKAGGSNDD